MARILIISPGSPCRNPRPLKEAEALGQAGHEVTLLTLSEGPAYTAQELALTAGRPFRHESVGRAASRLQHWLQRARRRLAVQATTLGLESLRALGDAGALRRRAFAIPADLTIVHNELSFVVGCDLLQAGRRVAADFEDWYSEDLLPADRRHRPLGKLRRLEQTLLQRGVYTSTTSLALSRALAERYAAPAPFVLPNAFPLQPDPRRDPTGTPPSFFWFSQTIGPGRGLEEFLDAWQRTTRPSRIVLLGQLRAGYDQELLARLPASRRADLTFRPLVPPGELPGIIARHDLGLALEPTAPPNKDLTISNKILQYLNAGLAVIASPTQGQREVLARAPDAGLLASLTHPAELAAQLDRLLADPTRLQSMGHAARRAAEQYYCWEKNAPVLLARVAAALALPAR